MPDYEKMYFELFNAVTDAIEILQKAQQTTEEIYISEKLSDKPCEKLLKILET